MAAGPVRFHAPRRDLERQAVACQQRFGVSWHPWRTIRRASGMQRCPWALLAAYKGVEGRSRGKPRQRATAQPPVPLPPAGEPRRNGPRHPSRSSPAPSASPRRTSHSGCPRTRHRARCGHWLGRLAALMRPLQKWLILVTNRRRPFLKARSVPRRHPNCSRRFRPGIPPGNTDLVPALTPFLRPSTSYHFAQPYNAHCNILLGQWPNACARSDGTTLDLRSDGFGKSHSLALHRNQHGIQSCHQCRLSWRTHSGGGAHLLDRQSRYIFFVVQPCSFF